MEKAPLQEQVQITKGIRVSVISEPLTDNSEPDAGVYAFSYTVTIQNTSPVACQLIERHWIVNSGGERVAEVVGPGVIGEQPNLNPGESFKYTSGAVIQDPIGFMDGSYTFRDETGKFFEVGIPRFDLQYPIMVH